MSRKGKRDLYYIMPSSREGVRRARINFWIITILVGVGVASALGALLYYKDRL